MLKQSRRIREQRITEVNRFCVENQMQYNCQVRDGCDSVQIHSCNEDAIHKANIFTTPDLYLKTPLLPKSSLPMNCKSIQKQTLTTLTTNMIDT